MAASSASSLIGPSVIRVPSYNSTSSDSILSTVLQPISACTPQELLPIISPMVQRFCVARQNDPNGKLTIVGRIGGVQGARGGIEPGFAADVRAQPRFKRSVSREVLMRQMRFRQRTQNCEGRAALHQQTSFNVGGGSG